jgi:hypothetical protein
VNEEAMAHWGGCHTKNKQTNKQEKYTEIGTEGLKLKERKGEENVRIKEEKLFEYHKLIKLTQKR